MNDDIFSALADPTRRAILARLVDGETTVNELIESFHLTQPTISRHVSTLERAGLVSRRRMGQSRPIALRADALHALDDWLAPFRDFWTASLTELETYADEVADADRKKRR